MPSLHQSVRAAGFWDMRHGKAPSPLPSLMLAHTHARLSVQVSELSQWREGVLDPPAVCLQAALPGAAEHEHRTQTETAGLLKEQQARSDKSNMGLLEGVRNLDNQSNNNEHKARTATSQCCLTPQSQCRVHRRYASV